MPAQILPSPRLNKARIAIQTIERMDALFVLERDIKGRTPQERVRVRNERGPSLGLPSLTISPRRAGSLAATARLPHHEAKPIADTLPPNS
jgi:hypothetical protein